MNIDCIFNILQFSDITIITKILSVNKDNTNINTSYFWKLLCERDKIKISSNKVLPPYKMYKIYYNSLKAEFRYGRCYQLVIDNSTNDILLDYYDSKSDEFDIIGYMNSKTKVQIINLALDIIRKNNIKLQHTNKYIPKSVKYHNKFYLGRCVQFIMNHTTEISFDQLFTKSFDAIIGGAHFVKSISLLKKEEYTCIMCHKKSNINVKYILDNFALYERGMRMSFYCSCSTTVFTVTFTQVSHLDACHVNCNINNKKKVT